MKISFLGAAGEVTGSQHLIETAHLRVLLDCGLFQGRRVSSRRKNEQFRCNPSQLDGVILSHAHIDHSGNLPGLYRAGFRGPIFCTRATADVAEIMLRDSARIQEEDARYMSRHLEENAPPIEPLYTEEDARATAKLFEPLDYGEWHELSPEFHLRFSDAGHILGSAICELRIQDKGDMRRVVFTGDLGRRDLPILRDPTPVPGCDILITESTYGNRVHPPAEDLQMELLRIIRHAADVGGRVVIPAFSLGRTQQVVYFLNELRQRGHLPSIPVYVDSPLSVRLTDVYRTHQELMDEEAQRILKRDDDLFEFPELTYIRSQQESAALNYRKGAFVVISASGMCENGRVRHHLKHAVSDERNTIVIIGYQAAHTLGRRIVERRPNLHIFNRRLPLNAKVEVLNGLSAHADVNDFKWWFERMASDGGIGQAFLVHGEPDAQAALAEVIRDYCDEDPILPELYESFEV
ncbi:MAG: MBL fold metallo-hydrolase [Planctomycetaceae bacterium]